MISNSIASYFYQIQKKMYTYRFTNVFLLQEYELLLGQTPGFCCDLPILEIKCSLQCLVTKKC